MPQAIRRILAAVLLSSLPTPRVAPPRILLVAHLGVQSNVLWGGSKPPPFPPLGIPAQSLLLASLLAAWSPVIGRSDPPFLPPASSASPSRNPPSDGVPARRYAAVGRRNTRKGISWTPPPTRHKERSPKGSTPALPRPPVPPLPSHPPQCYESIPHFPAQVFSPIFQALSPLYHPGADRGERGCCLQASIRCGIHAARDWPIRQAAASMPPRPATA